MTTMNEKALTEITDRNPTAEAYFIVASERSRNVRHGKSSLDSVKSQLAKAGYVPVPQEILSMFRDLERAGVGRLSGNAFRWSVPLKSVTKAILGKPSPKVEPKTEKAPTPEAPSTNKSLIIVLGKGRRISMSLPEDISSKETELFVESFLKEVG